MNPNRRVNPLRQFMLETLKAKAIQMRDERLPDAEVSWPVPHEFAADENRRKYAIMLHGVCSYFRSRNPELEVNTHYGEDFTVTVKMKSKHPRANVEVNQ